MDIEMFFRQFSNMLVWKIRPDCQKVMFSATWPEEVQVLSRKLMTEHLRGHGGDSSRKNAVFMLRIGSRGLTSSHSVKQLFCFPGDNTQKLQVFFLYKRLNAYIVPSHSVLWYLE